jgi:hypothetical protein
MEPPVEVIMEWDLINIILDYTNMRYDEDFRGGISCMAFTTEEIKKYYAYLYHSTMIEDFEDIYEYLDTKEFDKKYGENGLDLLLSYPDGVEYDELDKTWYLYREYYDYIMNEYKKETKKYGKNFDKPWIKNLM